MKAFTKLLFVLVVSCLSALKIATAQDVIPPTLKVSDRSFAIIVDKTTFEQCKKDILAYKMAVESDQLPTYIVAHTWKNPEQVKKEIQLLYSNSKLEGVILIGDIPIPMISKAQHLTNSATPIPSDRFYDDFALTFDFVEQSKTNPALFIYNLAGSTTNGIKSNIYSARIKPLRNNTTESNKYQQISAYLQKAANRHQHNNSIDHILSYTTAQSLHSALSTYSSESLCLEEHFPLALNTNNQIQSYNGRYHNFSEEETINLFGKNKLDIALIQLDLEKDSITAVDRMFTDHTLKRALPSPIFTIFSGQQKGDFTAPTYTAGQFIFSEGQSISVLANTVNPSSPKNALHLIGLLNMGVNIGRWAQLNNSLETHIIGDPTLCFHQSSADSVRIFLDEKSNKKLLEALPKVKSADAKSLLITQLSANRYEDISKLVTKEYDNSDSPSVRYTCMSIGLQQGSDTKTALLKKGIKDSDELIRGYVIHAMAKIGDPSFIPSLVEAYIENQHSTYILAQVRMALHAFNRELIKNIAEPAFATAEFADVAKEKEKFYEEQLKSPYAEIDKSIFDNRPFVRRQGIAALRIINYHPSVDRYLEFVRNSKIDVDLRIAMLESLTGFGDSYRKSEIIAACQELIVDTRHSRKLRDEARRTLNTIR